VSRIAVVTTTYNMEGTLGDALASVREQTRPPTLHVIVDDGSQDDTPAIVDHYRAGVEYPVFVIRWTVNRGHAAALNAGIRLTRMKADWYVKLDADDTLVPRALERIGNNAEKDCNVIYAPFQTFGDFSFVHEFPPFNPETLTEEPQIPGPSAFAASLWDAVGGFDETMRYGEDWDFWIRAERAVGLKPAYLLSPLWNYRVYRTWKERHADQPHQDRFKDYWRGHHKDNIGTRTWAGWLEEQLVAA
jgi:glycosyltransferase involved in cell wall biosynthesis